MARTGVVMPAMIAAALKPSALRRVGVVWVAVAVDMSYPMFVVKAVSEVRTRLRPGIIGAIKSVCQQILALRNQKRVAPVWIARRSTSAWSARN